VTAAIASRAGLPGVRARWWVPIGAVAGLCVGVIARLWMRWISTDPEFSWAGTIAILTGFTLFGSAQAGVAVYRRNQHARWRTNLVRVLSGVLSLGIFGAAGAVMFPTVSFGGLAAWRSDWWRVARAISACAAAPLVVVTAGDVIDDFGWSIATVGRLSLYVAIYAVVIVATKPTLAPVADGWRLPRAVRWAAAALVVAATLVIIAFRDSLFV
jgi:hypothetical protein